MASSAVMDPFTQTLLSILEASPALRAKLGKAQGAAAPVAPGGPQEAAPADDGSGELPGGTFTPQRLPDPPQHHVAGIEQGPIGRMLGLDPSVSQFFRRAGAGMSAVRGNPQGDPFVTAAQGFGGAQEYAAQQDQAAEAARYENEKETYDRGVAEQERQRQAVKDAQDLKFKQLAEGRAAKTSELSNQKTAIEIRRLARGKGVTPDQYLRARAQAQKDADDQIVPRDQRDDFIEQRTNELLDKAGVAAGGISDSGPGVSGSYTATNPDTGETLTYENGQWVNEDGSPYQEQ